MYTMYKSGSAWLLRIELYLFVIKVIWSLCNFVFWK